MIVMLVLASIVILETCLLLRKSRARNQNTEQEKERQLRYNHEMGYLENLIFHLAYKEGFASKERLCELIPEMRTCTQCQKNIKLILLFNEQKKDLLIEVNSERWFITSHIRQRIRSAPYFYYALGLRDTLPANKIKFHHGACHIFATKSRRSA